MDTFSTYVYIAGDGFRSRIPVQSSQQLLAALLGEFCKMNRLNPDAYTLRKGKRMLDLSLPWRLSGLSARTELEIVKRPRDDQISASEAQCTIALTMQDGKRMVNKFSLDSSLWKVLLVSESSPNAPPITGNFKPEGEYLQPIVTYMNTSFKSLKDLEETTLSGLGLRNGQSCLLRLRHEMQKDFNQNDPNFMSVLTALRQQKDVPQSSCETTWSTTTNIPEDALTDTTSQFSISASESMENDENVHNLEEDDENMLRMDDDGEVDDEDEEEDDGSESGATSTADPLSKRRRSIDDVPMRDDESEVDSQQAQEQSDDMTISDVKVFTLDPSTAPDATRFDVSDFGSDLDERDFQLTSSEIKSLLQEAAEKRKLSQAFISKSIKEKKRVELVYDKCVVRFRFTSGLIAQAIFKPTHTVRDVKQFIQEMVIDDQEFMLYVAPPVRRIDTPENLDMTIKEMHFLPAVILNVSLDRKYYEQETIENRKKGIDYTAPTELLLKDRVIQEARVVDGMESLQERTVMPRNLNLDTKSGMGVSLGSSAPKEDNHNEGQNEKKKIPKWLKL